MWANAAAMTAYPFVTLDVFTDQRFGGNPLAVFPDAAGLDAGTMQALAREFGEALAAADSIVVLPIYPARESAADFPGIDGHLVAVATADAACGRPVAWMPGFDEARALLTSSLRDGDVCLVMGAGDVDSLARSLLTADDGA